MGISIMKLSGSGSISSPPEPRPHVFSLKETESIGPYTIALIHYPGCTTYKGHKLLVFQETVDTLKMADSIDPHFLEHGISRTLLEKTSSAVGKVFGRDSLDRWRPLMELLIEKIEKSERGWFKS